MTFIEFKNKSAINLLYGYSDFEFHIRLSNLLIYSIYSKQSFPWFLSSTCGK